MLLIVTGNIDSGKTTLTSKIAEAKDAGGFLSIKVFDNGRLTGYDLLNLETTERLVLARNNIELYGPSIGSFTFSQKTFDIGIQWFKSCQKSWRIIDEIGPLELRNQGFAPIIGNQMENIILVIRDRCLYACIDRWKLKPGMVLRV